MNKSKDDLLAALTAKDIAHVLIFCFRSAARAERDHIVGDYMFRDFEGADRHAAEAARLEERASYFERTFLYDDDSDAL